MEPTGTNGRTRHTLSDPLVGRVSSCGGSLVGCPGTLFVVVTTTMLVRRLICLRPLSGSRTATTGIGRVAGFGSAGRPVGVGRYIGFAVVMAQVRRPVPFRTRKLRPGTAMVLHSRGCGRVARRRIQRWTFWSSPPGDSRKVFFCFAWGVFLRPVGDYGRRQAGLREDSSSGWRFSDCGRPVGVLVIPVSG